MADFEATFELGNQGPIEAQFDVGSSPNIDAVFEINAIIKEHNFLTGRDAENCHPIEAITGLSDELDDKVDKVSTANMVYGTDINGEQTTYDANSFGQVDDVQVGGVSVVQNKIASLGTMAGESESDYRTAHNQDIIDSGLGDRIGGIEDTIGTYGDIVTHNVSEFATSAQGSLADSSLQPSDVINNTASTVTDKPLSANMGKSLQDQVDNLKARGRFLALWNCATGLAQSNPPESPYTYQAGDYFIVGTISSADPAVNYKPNGSTYTTGVASVTVETNEVAVDDVYYYDGTNWRLQSNTQKTVSFVNIAGDPYDNTNLASALNEKQDELTAGAGIDITNNTISNTGVRSVSTGSTNGTISVNTNGTSAEIAVAGLGTAAYTSSTNYATSVQGDKADSAIQGVKVNGTELTPDSDKKVEVTVPTDTNDLSNGAGYITSSALNGYATETWVGQQGFLTSTALENYVTINTNQTITSQKTFKYTETAFQDSVARFVSTYQSSNQGWRGRIVVGAKDYTFIIGTYNGMAAIGGHKFEDSSTEAGATWSDVYFQPDGDKAVYFGGWSWTQNSGWFKVQNDATNTGGKVQVNKGSITSASWKDVAYRGENVSDFNNDANYITSASIGNATLKIQKNGTDVATFTANSSTDATANITVPTDTNDLTNGAGYITGITSSDVTTALGYTPYDSSNPNGYTSNTGTVTSVNNVNPVGGNVTISIPTVDQSYDGTSANAQSGVAVKSAIDSAISSVYKPAGSVAFASLPALSSSIEGYVYNVTDSFTTTSDFVEGSGKTYPAGTNVVCIDVGSSVYKWDVLSGMVDLSGYVPTSRTINNKALTSNISLTASDVGALPDSTVIPTVNNATLTIQKNGTNVTTFTANSSSNKTANITVPTDTGDLTNGAGFITGITSSDITTALGYTPYSSSNPSNYVSASYDSTKEMLVLG